MSWQPLRDFLREHFAEQLDHYILHDPDADARAWLARHRERVLDRLTDQAELITMRRILAEREAEQEQPRVVKLNGHRVAVL